MDYRGAGWERQTGERSKIARKSAGFCCAKSFAAALRGAGNNGDAVPGLRCATPWAIFMCSLREGAFLSLMFAPPEYATHVKKNA